MYYASQLSRSICTMHMRETHHTITAALIPHNHTLFCCGGRDMPRVQGSMGSRTVIVVAVVVVYPHVLGAKPSGSGRFWRRQPGPPPHRSSSSGRLDAVVRLLVCIRAGHRCSRWPGVSGSSRQREHQDAGQRGSQQPWQLRDWRRPIRCM